MVHFKHKLPFQSNGCAERQKKQKRNEEFPCFFHFFFHLYITGRWIILKV